MKSFPSPLHQKSDHRGKLLEELTCNRYYSSVFECFCLASFFFSKVRVSSHRGYGFFPSGPPLKTVTFRERNCIAKMGGGHQKPFTTPEVPEESFFAHLDPAGAFLAAANGSPSQWTPRLQRHFSKGLAAASKCCAAGLADASWGGEPGARRLPQNTPSMFCGSSRRRRMPWRSALSFGIGRMTRR